jgi:hypothetical protein
LNRIRGKLTYSNVMVTVLAVLVIGGGSAYAATTVLPKNSVGSNQIKKEAVTPAKLSKASKAALTGPAGPRGADGATGQQGQKGDKGERGEPGPLTGAAGGALAGNYPNPTLATKPVTATGYSSNSTPIGTTCTHYAEGEVTITVPSAGTVNVQANIVLLMEHTNGQQDYAEVHLSDSAGSCDSRTGEAGRVVIPSSLPTFTSPQNQQTMVPALRSFSVPAAGTYTYYLNGVKTNTNDPAEFYYAALTATFIPS